VVESSNLVLLALDRAVGQHKVRCCGMFVLSQLHLLMPPRPNIRVLRDIKARQGVADNEIARRAYLYVARNQTLPAQVRYRAQLQLNTFGRYTRPTTVKNRCTVTGRGRGVMGEFGLCRVRSVFVCVGALTTDTKWFGLDSTSFE
jgi:small subunit ribosomal protein S14